MKIFQKLKPKKEVPKEFKDRLWLEIVLLALCTPAAFTFFLFSLKPICAMLTLTALFLIVDGLRLYYYGYLGHYTILSGDCTGVREHKRFKRTYIEICFECEGILFNTWTNRTVTASEGCLVTAIVPEHYTYRESDGIRHINTIFLKVTAQEDTES